MKIDSVDFFYLTDAIDLNEFGAAQAPLESGSPQKPGIGAFSGADFRY
jgi:hypothetical protein